MAGRQRWTTPDLMLAAGLLVGALTEIWLTRTAPGPRGLGTGVAVLSTVPLLWRRTRPGVALTGALAAILLPLVVEHGVEVDGLVVLLAWLVAVHAANAHGTRLQGLGASVAVTVALVAAVFATPAEQGSVWVNSAWVIAVVAAATAAGQVLHASYRRASRDREQVVEAVRVEERRRIAAELHDVVAHGLALMVVQAGAAQAVLRSDPQRAEHLLDGVQETGGGAARELRRMLQLLGETEEVRRHHGLPEIADLVDSVRRTGLPIRLELGRVADLAPSQELTCYRVVQESLTNALKHGVRRHVDVVVRSVNGSVEVQVTDRGSAGGATVGDRGRGLLGLRERLELVGGRLEAGSRGPDWTVTARLPVTVGIDAASAQAQAVAE